MMRTVSYISNFTKKPEKGNIKNDLYKIGMDLNYDIKL